MLAEIGCYGLALEFIQKHTALVDGDLRKFVEAKVEAQHLAWNEAFWTLNLSAANAAPLTAFIASYSSPEGLFWAKLSAASTLAIAPIVVLGWFSQKQLVRGLTFGAVK